MKEKGRIAVLRKLATTDWYAIAPALSLQRQEGSGTVSTWILSMVIKIGSARDIENEATTYRSLKELLGDAYTELFPAFIVPVQSGKRQRAAFVERFPGETLEKVILNIAPIVRQYGVHHKIVERHQEYIDEVIKKVLLKLKILHRTISVAEPSKEWSRIISEWNAALAENMKRAQLEIPDTFLIPITSVLEGKISAAHRDLSTSNIMVNGAEVRFIDPRRHVPNTTSLTTAAPFASPLIDLIAFDIGLERKELEVRHDSPGFKLEARCQVTRALQGAMCDGADAVSVRRLAEAIVRSAYAACRCDYCLAPERAWLHEHMRVTARRALVALQEETSVATT